MTKREFLKELEDRLQMLDEKERKDMIEEYSQHISMCMKSGMKEEEAQGKKRKNRNCRFIAKRFF